MISSLILLSLLPLSIARPLDSIIARQTACVAGVHIIAARGSEEDPGEGKPQAVSDLIKAGVPNSDDVAVDFPATLLEYESSETAGVANMAGQIQNYTQACPNTKIVLVGFSQGGQIVGDVLGGGSFGDPPSPPLPTRFTKNIIAALQFGDPAHVSGKPYNKGNGTHGGIFARDDTAALDTYGSILQSYCDDGDPVCDEGIHLSVHSNEVPANQNAASQFAIAQAKAAGLTTTAGLAAKPKLRRLLI